MSSIIKDIRLRKIFDSRGSLTVEAFVIGSKAAAVASAPSGTSTGKYEVNAFPNGIDRCIGSFLAAKGKIIGMEAADQKSVDGALHRIGGPHLSKIGGSVSTAVSIATAKLAAAESKLELYEYVNKKLMHGLGIKKRIPRLVGNVVGGGVHSIKGMSIQEILIAPDAKSFFENAMISEEAHRGIGSVIAKESDSSIGRNIEGAWSSPFGEEKNLSIVRKVADSLSKRYSARVGIGVDFAASEFYSGGKYRYRGIARSGNGQLEFVERLSKEYDIEYIEDPFHEEDFRSFGMLTAQIGNKRMIVGDDLYATNPSRIKEGIFGKATNAVLIKVNQIGTLSDTIDAVALAYKGRLANVVSHRSGETTDSFIAHLAVAFGSSFIKCGVSGGERVAKINELARIEAIEASNKQ